MVQHKTAGRPALPGPRYESGRRKPKGDPRGQAIWNRLRAEGARFGLDERHGSQLALLGWQGELSGRQVEAGFTVGRIYAAFSRAKRKRPNTVSPSYVRSFGDPDGQDPIDPDELDALERKIGSAVARWTKLQKILKDDLPVAVHRHARGVVESLCVHDRRPNPSNMESVRWMLDRIASAFDIPNPDAGYQPSSIAITARRPPRQTASRTRVDRDALVACWKQMQPDATEEYLELAWQRFQAQRGFERAKVDREVFNKRRDRGRVRSNR